MSKDAKKGRKSGEDMPEEKGKQRQGKNAIDAGKKRSFLCSRQSSW